MCILSKYMVIYFFLFIIIRFNDKPFLNVCYLPVRCAKKRSLYVYNRTTGCNLPQLLITEIAHERSLYMVSPFSSGHSFRGVHPFVFRSMNHVAKKWKRAARRVLLSSNLIFMRLCGKAKYRFRCGRHSFRRMSVCRICILSIPFFYYYLLVAETNAFSVTRCNQSAHETPRRCFGAIIIGSGSSSTSVPRTRPDIVGNGHVNKTNLIPTWIFFFFFFFNECFTVGGTSSSRFFLSCFWII